MASFQTSPGTRDILPPHAGRWRAFSDVFADTVESAGYECIIPPMFEDLGVFLRTGRCRRRRPRAHASARHGAAGCRGYPGWSGNSAR
ncbi:MAG: ATP phosphoribosyltransferase regulatory subunit, partial [Actinomycetota bacterium]